MAPGVYTQHLGMQASEYFIVMGYFGLSVGLFIKLQSTADVTFHSSAKTVFIVLINAF